MQLRFSLTAFFLLFSSVAFSAAVPSVSVNTATSPFIGDALSVTLSFDNASPNETGYGPYIDLFLPATGVDGTGAAIDDGITYVNGTASYLGSPLTTTTLVFDAAGNVTHPYAVNSAGNPVVVNISSFPGAKAGDQLIVIQMPFGSFTPTQPPADVTLTAQLSNLADLGVGLQVHARGGFRYGNDALDNPTLPDPTLIGTNQSVTVVPELIRINKIYIGPEGETATGPNFKRQFRIEVSVAPGQVVTNLALTDTLPNTIQYDSFVSATPTGTPALPIVSNLTTPGGTILYTFASITGTGGTDATFTFQYYVPRIDSGSAVIINATSGDDVNIGNNVSANYTWATPIDTRDTGMTSTYNPAGFESQFTAKSIAIQKSAAIINDVGFSGATPGDTVEYTLNIQISDYFAFQDLVIDDLLSDGQRFNGAPPTLTFVEHATSGPSAAFNAANYSVTVSTDGILNNNTPVNEGTTAMQFRLSNELITRGFDGKLVGGGIPDAGTGASPLPNNPPLPFGGTVAVIRYRVLIQDKFTDNAPSNEPALNARDVLTNTVQIAGDLLQVTNVTTLTGQAEADGSGAQLQIQFGQLVKSIYAINGSTSLPTPPTPIQISPGDVLTYRLRYTLPSGDVENLRLRDFLPLPIFRAGNPALDGNGWTFDDVTNGVPPAAGHAHFGPLETLRPNGPTLSGMATANTAAGAVTSVTVTSTGTAYAVPPPISFFGPVGSGAAGFASLNPTSVASVTVLNPGVYSSAPTVGFTGGGGTGAAATAVVGVGAIAVTNGGTGFTTPPTISFTGGGGTGAAASANMGLRVVNVTGAGTGYTAPPAVTFNGGGGGGATAVATLTPLSVTSIAVTNAGTGYATPPTVTISGGGGTGATATATVGGGLVTAINITANGTGYTSTPTVTLTGGGGTGATASALVTGGVASITITQSGGGYTTVPTVTIAAPQTTGTTATANTTLEVKTIVVTAGGTGYATAPAVNFAGGGGTGAAATATLGVSAVNVTSNGSGYTTLPTVTFTGGGGAGAEATPVLTPSTLASITVTSGGTGYTTAPSVTVGLNVPPIITTVTANGNNTVIFDYGTYSNLFNVQKEIDVLFSVRVTADPFADELFLTNQVQSAEGSTQMPSVEINDNKIIQVLLTEPSVQTPAKGIVAYESTSIPITATPTISATARLATTGTLTGATFNATGGSASRGGFTNAPTTVDGVTVATNDLILVKNQAAPAENGIYSVLNAGTRTWERWTSFDENGEVIPGYTVFVSAGNTNFNFYYSQQTAAVTVNTTAIVWSQIITAPITFVPPSGGPSNFSGGVLGSTNIGTTDLLSGVVDAGDTIRFAISMMNAGRSDAYNVRFGDTIPNGFIKPGSSAGLNLAVRRGDLSHTSLTGAEVADVAVVATTATLPGATFTTAANGTFTFGSAFTILDGVTLKTNDLVLVKNQGAAEQNGVYRVASGTSWVRATNFDTAAELSAAFIGVRAGTSTGRYFQAGAIATLNTSAVNFTIQATTPGYFFNYNSVSGAFYIELTDTFVAGPGTGAGGLNRGKDINGFQLGDGTNSVVATYDLTLASTAQPCSTIRNSATLLNFAGAPGGDSYPSGQTDGADTLLKNFTLAKTLTSTEINETGNNAANQATIGEFVTYTLTVTVPEGTSPNTVMVDTLDAGLAFVQITSETHSGAVTASFPTPTPTPANTTITSSGTVLTFNLGTVTNTNTNNGATETIVITYQAVVLNTTAVQGSNVYNNLLTLTHDYVNVGAGLPTGTLSCGPAPASAATVQIVEPILTVSKGVATTVAGPFNSVLGTALDGGDAIFYQIVIVNPASNSTVAFDLFLQDIVPSTISGLTISNTGIGNAAGAAGGQIRRNGTNFGVGNPPMLTDFPFTGNTLNVNGATTIDILPDTRMFITFTGSLNSTVNPGASIQNDATVRWTSLDGAITNRSTYDPASDERTGGTQIPPPNVNLAGDSTILDNYAATATATATTAIPAIVKSIVATSENDTTVVGGVETVAIGEIVRYRIAITLPEGTAPNLQVRDNLPAGLQYLNDGTARVAFISTSGTGINSTSPGALAIALGTTPGIAGSAVVAPGATAAFLLADNNVGVDNSIAADGTDTFGTGTDIFFKVGTLVNSDSDVDQEFVVIEFNAIVENVTGNQAGVNLDNTATLFINGGIIGVVINTPSSYATTPTITFSAPPAGTTATGTVLLGVAGVNSVTVTSGGLYTSVPTVSFTGGGGTGAAATANLTATTIGSTTVTAGGSGYTTVPTVTPSAGAATFQAVLAPTSLSGFALVSQGNYADPPRVDITGGGGSGATASAIMEVFGATITSGGTGYATAPTVTISGGGGSGATATATVSGGAVNSISITAPGGGFTSRPTISFSGGGGTGAAADAILRIESLNLLTAGSGYTGQPTISFTGGGGSGGGAATAVFTATSVASINIVSGGSYTTVPTLNFAGGGGTGAAATAFLTPTPVASVTVTAPPSGSGYSSPPVVEFSGGGPVTGAAATAVLANRPVAAIVITNPGSGYLTAPNETFAPTGANTTQTVFIDTTPAITVRVVEPQITNLRKTLTTAPTDAGDTVTYTITFSNTVQQPNPNTPLVRVATTAASDTSGATFSSSGTAGRYTNAPLTIDGVTLAVNDRVLVKNDGTASRNGIYKVTAISATASTLERATDADTAAEIGYLTRVQVTAGSVNANRVYLQDNTPITLNTTNITYQLVTLNPAVAAATTGIIGSGATSTTITGVALTIDGVTLALGQRILVKNQTTTSQNGIYTVTALGATATLTRAADFDTLQEGPAGYEAFVTGGTTNANTTWALPTAVATFGTTGQTWNRVDQAPAYDVVLGDTLPASLNLTSVSASVAGTTMPAGVNETLRTVTTGPGGSFSLTFDELPAEINIGGAVKNITITVNATVISTALAGQGLPNTATVRYTSLPGGNGTVGGTNTTGSSTPGAAGSATGERNGSSIGAALDNTPPVYSATLNNYAVGATVNTTLNTPMIDKRYKDGSISADDTTLSTSLLANIVIGEQLTWDILVTLPEGITNTVSVFDTVPFGLRVDSFEIITTAGSGAGQSLLLTNNFSGAAPATIAGTTATPFSPGSAPGATFTYNFGNITVPANATANDTSFVIRVNSTLRNIIENQATVVLNQPASMTYSDPDDLSDASGIAATVTVADPSTANDPTFTVQEPVLTILKGVNITGADAGDTITYTVTITNPTANVYAAYDVTFRDIIDSSLTNVVITGVTASGFAGGTFVAPTSSDFRFNSGQLELNPAGPLAGDLDMNASASIVLTFTADLAGTVSTGQVVPNKADIFWTTLNAEDVDGSDADERTGAGVPNPQMPTQATPVTIINDQAISSAVTITAVAPVVVSHEIFATSQPNAVSSGTNLAIGEFATIRVSVSLPEGVTRNLTITEALPPGYAYVPGSVVLDATHPIETSLNDTHPGTGTTAFGGSGLVAPTVSRVTAGTNFQNGDDARFTFTSPITTTGDNNLNNNTFSFSFQVLALDVATNDGLGPVQTILTPTGTWVVGDVVAATTANLAGFNATLGAVNTGGFAGAPATIDGVTLADNDLVLVKNQGTASQNGIYRVVNAAGGAWIRWENFDQSNEIVAGYRVEVVRGTTNIGTAYTQTTASVVINTSSIVFASATATAVLVDLNSAGNPLANGIDATIIEPRLQMTKGVVVNGSGSTGDAGDPATYTITISHVSASPNISTENAYDLNLTDPLPSQFVPSGTVTATITTAGDTTASLTLTGQNLATVTAGIDLNLGQTLTVTIPGTLSSTITPNQTYGNTATLTYNTLPDATTAETVDLINDTTPAPGGVNTAEDSERVTSTNASVNFTTTNGSYAKSLFSTDQAFTAGSNVAIGEHVTYALLVTVIEGTTPDLTVIDNLPPGLIYVPGSGTVITTAAASGGLLAADFNGTVPAPAISGGGGSGTDVQFVFGSISSTGDNVSNNNAFLITLQARTMNVNTTATVNQAGGVLTNVATFDISTDGLGVFTTPNVNVTVVEPRVVIAHTVTTSTVGLDAFDTVTYQIQLTNTAGNGATTDAFDVSLTSVLPTGFNITAIGSPTLTGGATQDVALAGVGGTTLTGAFDIPLAGTVTFTYSVVLPNTVTPNTTYTADANAFFSSLNGTSAVERTGADVADPEDNTPPTVNATLNNYAVGQDASITTVQPFSVTKTLAATSHTITGGTSGNDLAIGEVATFELGVTVLEGTTNSLSLVDTLPTGLTYVPSSAAVFNANGMTITGFAVNLAGSTLTISATSVVNPGNVDNAGAADTDTFTIRYQLLAANVAANNATNTKANNVVGTATNVPPDNTGNTVTTTIREPLLTMTKLLVTSGLDAGDAATYTFTITNTGDAAAYELNLTDTLDTDQTISQGALTPATALAITTSPGAHVTLSNAGNTAGALNAFLSELRVGETVVLTLTTRVAQSSNPGNTVSNSGTLTWTSLPGVDANERTGTGGVNDYTITSVAANYTLATPTIAKTIVSTANALGSAQFVAGNPDVTIGEVITYDLTVTFTEGITTNSVIADAVQDSAAGRLEILSAVVQATGANLSFSAPAVIGTPTDSVGSNGINDRIQIGFFNVTNTFDNVSNAADQIVVRVTARPVDTSTTGVGGPNVNGTALSNSGTLTYAGGTTVNSNTVSVDVVEPVLTLVKSSDDADGSVSFGQLVTYTVTVANTTANGSRSPAYDVLIRDLLPVAQLGLVVGSVTTTAGSVTTGNTAGDTTVAITVSQFNLNAANIIITYQAYIVGSTSPIDNTAKVFWDSLPADETTNTSGTYIPSGDGTPDRDYGAVATNEVFNATTDPAQDTERLTLGTASLGDYVWNDRDGDDVQDVDDPPIPGVVVYVDLNGNGIRETTEPSATTDAAGLYTISNLAAGTYTVRVLTSTLPAGLTQTFDLNGSQTDSSATVTLTAGQTRTDVDFGYQGNASLGDYVWNDRDGDGVQETGDPPIPGVTVFIDTNNNSALDAGEARAVTDAAGLYTIGGLPAGTFNVRVLTSSLPGGLTPTFDLDGIGTPSRASVTLVAAQNRTDVDFGYQGNSSLGDYVWNDRDGDGVQEAGDPPIPNVTVFIDTNNNGTLETSEASAVTNAAGLYTISGLPAGTYNVRVDTTTLPAGLTPTFDLDGIGTPSRAAAVVLAAATNRTDVDFGYQGNASLGDYVWNDRDADGVQEAGDPPIPGVTVFIDTNGNGTFETTEASAVTNAAGLYTISGLPAGSYSVRVLTSSLPGGLTPTFDLDGIGTPHVASTTLTSGQNRTDVDFGYQGNASIADLVWLDRDNDGTQDPGEPGIPSVTVFIDTNNNGTLETSEASAVTNASGLYLISGLPAGTYNVRVLTSTLPAGLTPTFDLDGTGTPSQASVPLVIAQNRTDVDFGYRGNSSISDFVWNDLDSDGVQDPLEPGIPNVRVYIDIDGDSTFDSFEPSSVTSPTGIYLLDFLSAGTYTVRVDTTTLPASVTQTYDLNGALDHAATVVLPAATNLTTVDFGYQGAASLGNYVWNDTDNDGVQDANEPGIPNITVNLFRDLNGDGDSLDAGEGLIATTVTGSTTIANLGIYGFSGLIGGNYIVRVDTTAASLTGAVNTFDKDDYGTVSNNSVSNVALGATESDQGVDFGYFGQASIGDRVWNDTNSNGVQDAGEYGIPGVPMALFYDIDNDGVIDAGEPQIGTTTTVGDGLYLFSGLVGGNYIVDVVTPPANAVLTGVAGVTDPEPVTALGATEDRLTIDFGYDGSASIGDRVWNDLDGDGVQDAGEPGISGVRVYIDSNNNGTYEAGVEPALLTGVNGIYTFNNLVGGTYVVRIDTTTLPLGVTQTFDEDGTATAHAATVVLGSTETHLTTDFGYQGNASVGDRVWLDLDNDTVQDALEPGIENVRVYLDINGNGTYEAAVEPSSVTNAANGIWTITGLAAGTYTSRVDTSTLPAGVTQTFDLDGVGTAHAATFALASAANRTDVDFGYRGNLSVGDFVWNDFDGDGVQDANEPGIANVTVSLYRDENNDGLFDVGDREIAQTTTGALSATLGLYSFNNLIADRYLVRITDTGNRLANTTQTYDLDGTATANVAGFDLTVTRTDVDFGYRGASTIGDLVWLDANGNATREAGEPGIDGVTVDLVLDLDGDGVIDAGEPVVQTLTTTGGGAYDFTGLIGGNYIVDVTDTGNVLAGTTLTGATGVTDPEPVALGSNQDYNDADFGYRGAASLGDFVWNDLDGDSVQDPLEPGIQNVRVYIDFNNNDVYDAATDLATTTSVNGAYTITGLIAGTYSVRVDTTTLPAGVTQTYDLNGILDHEATVTLTAMQNRTDVDFGYIGNASIGDLVWSDENGNAVLNGTELGIANITLALIRDVNGDGIQNGADAVIANLTTDANGNYLFTGLIPGSYIVDVTDTGNLLDGTTMTGATGVTDPEPVTVAAGDNYLLADFGYRGTGSVSGYVYLDDDGDGIRDVGETGFSGVTVTLTGTNDLGQSVTRTILTDINGFYSFTFLHDGNYVITETTEPPNTVDGIDTPGNFGGTTGTLPDTITFVLPPNGVGTEYNFGEGFLGDLAKTIRTTSDPTTAATMFAGDVAIGEVVRYRIIAEIPQGTLIDTQIRDNLPPGLQFLNDGQATIAFVSTAGLATTITSTAITGAQATDPTSGVTPTVVLPDTSISTSGVIGVNDDTYADGTDIFFKLGDVTNNEVDGNAENIVIEFNVIVLDTLLNVQGFTHSNTFTLRFDTDGDNIADDDRDSNPVVTTVVEPLLQIVKAADDTTPVLGQLVTYTLTITHRTLSDATAYDIQLRDMVPPGLILNPASITVVGATETARTITGNTISMAFDQLAVGATLTVTYTANVFTAVQAHADPMFAFTQDNTAKIYWDSLPEDETPNTSGNYPPDATPDRDYGALTPNEPHDMDQDPPQDTERVIIPVADLSVVKDVDVVRPNFGQNIVYTVTVNNAGPDPATNVAVEDVLPAGMIFVSSAPSQGTHNNATSTWLVGSIPVGGSATLLITVTVNTPLGVTNTAQVSASDQYDPDSTPDNDDPMEDDQDPADTLPQIIDLSLTKVVDKVKPNRVEIATFTIVVSNGGPNTATSVVVSDVLPTGLVFVSATPSQGTYDQATGVWTIGTILANGQATLSVGTRLVSVSPVTNVATITGSDQPDPDPSDNTDDATVEPQLANLQLTKTVAETEANEGDPLHYTITVTNLGPDPAQDVVVRDELPSQLSYVSSTTSQGTYDNTTAQWTIGNLPVGASVTMTLTTLILIEGDVVNMAQVMNSSQMDPNSTPGDNIPEQDDIDTASITTGTALEPGEISCFSAKFNFRKPNSDTLLFLAFTPIPPEFTTAANLPVQFRVAGLRFNYTLDAKGKFRSKTELVEIRKSGGKLRVTLKINKSALQGMTGVANKTVKDEAVAMTETSVKFVGHTYGLRFQPHYKAIQNKSGVLFKK